MRPFDLELAGRLERLEIASPALAGNPLGDPATRPLLCYLPPGYDTTDRSYPVVYVLQGFAASVNSWLHAPSSFEPTYLEAADALFSSGAVPGCLLVFVDGWTSLGGSQFLDSPHVGDYQRYLVEDVVDFVDQRFHTVRDPAGRALQGKSSGGYGALVAAMTRPDRFGGVAAHAADGAFELSMLPLAAEAHRALADGYGGDYDRFFEDFSSRRAFARPADFTLLEAFAMAACYSPAPPGEPGDGRGVELCFDPASGRFREEVFARWLAHDPVRLAPDHLPALAGLRAIWLDAGRSDEHYLDLASEQLSAVLSSAGISHHHELFPGRHSRNDHRLPLALAYLAPRLASSES